MRKQGLPLQRLATGEALLTVARDLHYADLSALYAAVGESHVSAQSVVTKLVRSAGGLAGAAGGPGRGDAAHPGAQAAADRRLRRRGRGRV